MTLEDLEKDVIFAAMKFHGDNKTRTAHTLGIAIRTLDSKLARYSHPAAAPHAKQTEKQEA